MNDSEVPRTSVRGICGKAKGNCAEDIFWGDKKAVKGSEFSEGISETN